VGLRPADLIRGQPNLQSAASRNKAWVSGTRPGIWTLFALLHALLLAGCFDGPPPAGPPPAQITAGFPPGGVANQIQIDTVERLPLHSAELVAPDGAETPANYLTAADSPLFTTGQQVTNDPWRVGTAGGPGRIAIAGGQPGATLRSNVQVLTLVSSASISLPDPIAYQHDWQHYRIRLGFGVPPAEIETREIAAPEPPPPAPTP